MLKLPERLPSQTANTRKALEQFAFDARVAAPGIIQGFDPAKQTVTVQLSLRERINLEGNISDEEIPLLVDVPIFMPRAGGFVLTLPVKPGDECLVVFGDCCMDAWWQSGGIQNQIDRRRHDLSDGFALLGVWSQPRVISGYSTDSAQLRNESETVMIEIAGSSVNVIAPTVNVTGSGQVNVSGNGHTIIEGRDFLAHEHTGVEPGGGNTGGVV